MTEFEKTRLRQLRQDLSDEIVASIELEFPKAHIIALQTARSMLDAALADIALECEIKSPPWHPEAG